MGEFLSALKLLHNNKEMIIKYGKMKIKKIIIKILIIVLILCLAAGIILIMFKTVQDKVVSVVKKISSVFTIQTTADGQDYFSFGTADFQKLENTLNSLGVDLSSIGLDLESGHIQKYMKAELATGLPKILSDEDKDKLDKYISDYNDKQEDEKGFLEEENESDNTSNNSNSTSTNIQEGFNKVTGHENDGYTSVTKVGNRIYNNLKQYEGSYAETPYWSGTIHTSGCGPTSIAICLSGLGQDTTPRYVIDTCGLTYSNPDIMSEALNKLNVKNTLVGNGMCGDAHSLTEDVNIIKNHLSTGKPIMLSLAGGNKFTGGGHYVCLLGENSDGSIILSDPGHSDDRTKELIAGETVQSMVSNYVNAYILIDSDNADAAGVSGVTGTISGKQDYVDGIINVVRKDENGNSKELKYMKSSDFDKKVSAGDDDVLNYFTIDSKFTMYVVTVTETYKDGSLEVHKLNKQTISYKNAVEKYAMPCEFLVALALISENPNWVDAVADIALKDTKLQIVVQDMHRTTETTETITIEREVHTKVTTTDEYTKLQKEEIHIDTITEKNITTTKVITGNIVSYLSDVDVWCAKGNLEYIKEELQTSSNSTSRNDDSKVEEPLASDEEGSRISSYRVDTTVNTETQNYKKGKSTMEITPDKFLGTLKNEKGEYEVGVRYDKDGEEVLYEDISGYDKPPMDNILSAADWLFDLIEKSERCQNQETVLKYFLYLYTGRNFGVTEVDQSLFGIEDFKAVTAGGMQGGSALIRFIQVWEEEVLLAYMEDRIPYSSRVSKCCTQDKSKLVVEGDGKGYPTIGYGICLRYNVERFAAHGIDISGYGYGDMIDASICDQVFKEELKYTREQKVLTKVTGLNLNEQQIDALTAVAYQYGNIDGFVLAYQQYGNTEGLRTAFSPFNSGPEENGRAAANWKLFHEGIYIDQEGNEIVGTSGISGTMIQKAKECHDYVATHGFSYGVGATIPISQGNQHIVDCSSFVSWVVYEAGHTEYAGGQKTSYYFEANPSGFQEVSYSDIQPGDIITYAGHVEIFAGFDGNQATVYNCGSNSSINAMSPTHPSRDPSQITHIFRVN